jgi:WD40 repeat protein
MINKIRQLLAIVICILTIGCNGQIISVSLSKTLTGHTEKINCLSYSPDGKFLASGSDAQSIFSDSGKFEIIIWNVSDGKILTHLTGHKSPIKSISFDRSGKKLVSADTKGEIRIWSMDSLKQIKFIDGIEWISTVGFTPDSKFIIGEYTFDKKVNIWDSETGELISTLPVNIQIGSMDISPDGSKIALSCYHKIQVWSLISKKELVSIDDNSTNGFGITYSPDGKKLAVGLSSGEIKIFDSETLKLLITFQGHFKPVLSVSFSKDNKHLVSGSSDQMIKVWNLQTQKEIKSLVNEHKGKVEAVSFSPTTNSFATAGEDKLIKIWKMQ